MQNLDHPLLVRRPPADSALDVVAVEQATSNEASRADTNQVSSTNGQLL